jgi:hypothetical protein
MSGSGPTRKHASVRARRNNPKSDFRSLSSAGRAAPAPDWPLLPDVLMMANLELARDRIATLQVELEGEDDGRVKGRLRRELSKNELLVARLQLQIEQAADLEIALWADLWAMPQAVIWEEAHAYREVAQYVRWKIRGEQGDLRAATEARQLSDRLGLNPLALLRLRAEVEHVDEVEDRGTRRRAVPTPREQPQGNTDDDPRSGLYAV